MSPEAIQAAYARRLDPADPEARIVLADLAAACFATSTTHVPGDPCSTARNEGQRAVFLYIAGRLGLPLIPGA